LLGAVRLPIGKQDFSIRRQGVQDFSAQDAVLAIFRFQIAVAAKRSDDNMIGQCLAQELPIAAKAGIEDSDLDALAPMTSGMPAIYAEASQMLDALERGMGIWRMRRAVRGGVAGKERREQECSDDDRQAAPRCAKAVANPLHLSRCLHATTVSLVLGVVLSANRKLMAKKCTRAAQHKSQIRARHNRIAPSKREDVTISKENHENTKDERTKIDLNSFRAFLFRVFVIVFVSISQCRSG
jgi:hypothetical protein